MIFTSYIVVSVQERTKVSIIYIVVLLSSLTHKYKIICTTRANKALNDWSHSTKLKVKKNGIEKVIIYIHSLSRENFKIWEHYSVINFCQQIVDKQRVDEVTANFITFFILHKLYKKYEAKFYKEIPAEY